MKSTKAIPDRWLEYNACGRVIEGTRIICFKVPLRKEVQVKEPSIKQLWDIPAVLAEIPRLSAVIDLTNTARYYNPHDFLAAKVLHKKILMPGRVIPPESKVKEFMDTVDEFLGRDCDSLVGVHCTHGLNRTGYMVCRYMRDRLGIAGPEAIKRFETARGYKIERDVYINGIVMDNSAPENEGKEREPLTHERNAAVNQNKVFNEIPDFGDQPNGQNHHRGGFRRLNNTPSKIRQFEANRGRRPDKPYARHPSIADRNHMRNTYNQEPSRSFNNNRFNRQYNHSRNNDDIPNNSRNEVNQFESWGVAVQNEEFNEVPYVDNQPSEYNRHSEGTRRFDDMYPRNAQFVANRGRGYNASQPSSFANRGRGSYRGNDRFTPYSKRGFNNFRGNDRFTPYSKRGFNNFRGNDRRNQHDRNDGGTSSNYDKNADNNWRKNRTWSSDNKSTWRNSDPAKFQDSNSKADHS